MMERVFSDEQIRRVAPSRNVAVKAAAMPVADPLEAGAAAPEPWNVLADPAMTDGEKRELLASWASDACAVDSMPNWRRLPGTGTLVPLDDILGALQALDRSGLS
ncbi:hypothetical protein ACFOYU_23100 [Microvirga sp. GCM10011540]|uniref:hypothetical protein n=1 Tax=Microvirga sp. GCM10011540 TaxID=3317338 RepID=UPI003610B4A2